jgi:hypothetical protein
METQVLSKSWGELFILSLPWIMAVIFVIGCVMRFMVYYTVRRHDWFTREFEKRVSRFVEAEVPGKVQNVSFYVLSKKMLEKTYYEVFELRDRLKRRKNDYIMATSDRFFLVRQGCAWMVKDILKQVKFLKWTHDTPKLLHITRSTLQHNPVFNRVFGLVPMGALNDVLNIMPGLFVVAGILGTFLGIAKGLPELGGMNMNDLDNSKLVMDRFLNEIAFAMQSSIVGIAFSLLMHFWNTFFSPERVYVSLVDRFETSLDLLWYRSDNNDFPAAERPFDEHRDPQEALAAEAVQGEVEKNPRGRDHDKIHKGKAS